MDWAGDAEPTSADIAGRAVLFQAKTGFDAITNNGAKVLGLRPLDLDGIVPMDPMDMRVGARVPVMGWRGFVNAADRALASERR